MKSYLFLSFSLVGALMGCSMAPPYTTPPMPIPNHFKEPGTWIKISTDSRIIPPDGWWHAFNDPALNRLHQQLSVANQDLKIAYTRYEDAYALAQIARASFFPTVQAIANGDRQQNSRTVANPPSVLNFNQFLIGGYASYEPDAWGAVRNNYLAATRQTQARAADVAAVQLSLHAELTNDYFALRGKEAQQSVLKKTIQAYKKALFLTQQRYQGGVSPIADVYEAQTQLENAKTLAADIDLQHAQLEHAIAVLVGVIPSSFSLPKTSTTPRFLAITPNLPSTLLQRRPDIVAAELRVRAANARIGVARAAFFPQFDLTGSGGFQSKTLNNIISKPSLFWSLGPLSLLTLIQPIAEVTVFDGGRLRNLLKRANADYYMTVANYRQTVLKAFQEVEDNLAALSQYDKEYTTQKAATQAAIRSWKQEQFRYAGGLVTFLQVVTVENLALQAELSLITIRTQRQIASVQLIKALGGGWSIQVHG